MFSPANANAPAPASRAITVAVTSGTKPRRISEPQVETRPAW